LLIEIQQTHLSFYILLPLLSVNTTQEELVAKEKKKKRKKNKKKK
jgi:flagellar motor switch protein FliM